MKKCLEAKYISNADYVLLDRGFYNQLFWSTMYETSNRKYFNFIVPFMEEFAEMYNVLPNWLYIIDVDVEESIKRRIKSGEPVTFSKKDFLTEYREKFKIFSENIKSKLYIDTTSLSIEQVADIVFKRIITL